MASNIDNKKVAKNTILLYCRTIATILISLYTSRVILNQLGVDNYGIYSVVGGVVSMFSVVSSAMSSAISRFITYELGRNDKERLTKIFSTSLNIQFIFAIAIFILGETIGVWFINGHLNIPSDRIYAANWVFQFSLYSFCIGVISIPYTASVIAHEKMSAFAYISIIEVTLKLGICYLLMISPIDKLIFYAFLMMMVSVIIRIVYGIYCGKRFEECKYRREVDKKLLKEIGRFSGWSFLVNTAWILNTQGINILINLFFGVVLNAARLIATQVEGAVSQFVNSFTTAINPQITKSYASGELYPMFLLICRGAKFSYLLLLILALPIMMETEYILKLWLKTVPEYTPLFVRLTIISVLVNVIGNSSYTGCLATGNIKKYSVYVTIAGLLVFPITYILFRLKFPPQSAYYAFIFTYICIDIIRVIFLKKLLGFPLRLFEKLVIRPILFTTVCALSIPLITEYVLYMDSSFLRFLLITFSCVVTTIISVLFIGLSTHEREIIFKKVHSIIKH